MSRQYEDIHYWAPAQAARTEVDFLLRRGRELLAIEVKAASRFQKDMLTGLRAIGDLRGVVRRLLVYTGNRSLTLDDGIDVWPHERFVAALAKDALWP